MAMQPGTTLVEEHPDVVEHYTAFLEAQFEAHLAAGAAVHARRGVAVHPRAASDSSGAGVHPVTPGTNSTIILNWFEELKQRVPTGR